MNLEPSGQLTRLGSVLHRLSFVGFIFVPAAVTYQVRAFAAAWWSATPSQDEFLRHFLVSLSLWGFFMAFLSLGDCRRMSPSEVEEVRRRRALLRTVTWVLAVSSIGTILLGLVFLFALGDSLQEVAVICFGTGLLGMARLSLDRLDHALTRAGETPGGTDEPRAGREMGVDGGEDARRPDVSVALLTRNGMTTLPAVLDALTAQRFDGAVEVVAVDTESTDGTAETLAARVDRVVQIGRREFDHGLTRNLALELARGELVVLLVQDAVPASDGWLEALTAPLRSDPGVAGTFARQLPRPDASRLTRWSLARWLAAHEEPHVGALADPGAWAGMHPMERLETAAFDNVCSCVRRSVWSEHPFTATPIAEDLAWGREVVLAGRRLVYVPAAAVLHSHERSARYELGRTYLVHRQLHALFGVRTVPTLPALVRSIAVTLSDHLRVLRSGEGPRPGAREVARALALAVAWPLGQYLGGRAAVSGREYLRPTGV